MHHKLIIALASLAALLGIWLFSGRETNSAPQPPVGSEKQYKQKPEGLFPPVIGVEILKEREAIAGEIKKYGVQEAYARLIRKYENEHFGVQHSAMHVFGELLYEVEGIEGLAICDSTFAFGCYHSFFGRALVDKGVGAIKQLDGVCVKKFGPLGTGCQHGIGHGLMEFYGRDRLNKALDACRDTTQVNELFGCTSGVFMEYNVPFITDQDNFQTSPRTLNPMDPHEPCNRLVNKKFRKSCYYEMAQWWDKVYTMDYKKIGGLCNEVRDYFEREACFQGTGNIAAPSSEYDIYETIKKCDLMPSREGEALCRSGASWSFFAQPRARSYAHLICAGLSETDIGLCVKKSDMIGNGEINEQ